MAVLKNGAHNKTTSLTLPDNFCVTFGVWIFNHVFDALDDAQYDVI